MLEVHHNVEYPEDRGSHPVEDKYPFIELKKVTDMFEEVLRGREVDSVRSAVSSARRSLIKQGKLPAGFRVRTAFLEADETKCGEPCLGVWLKEQGPNAGDPRVEVLMKKTKKRETYPDLTKVITNSEPASRKFRAGNPQPNTHKWKKDITIQPRMVNGYAYNCGDLVATWMHKKEMLPRPLAIQAGIEPHELVEYMDSKPIPEEVLRRIIIAVGAHDFEAFIGGPPE